MPFKFSLLILVITVMLFFIISPSLAVSSSYHYLSLWAKNIVPSILPFIICINTLLTLTPPHRKNNLSEFLCRALWGIPSNILYVTLISILSGYPMGAKTASRLYHSGKINSDELQRLLSFINLPNPVFTICAIGLFGNTSYGRLVFISCLLSSLLNAVFFKFLSTAKPVYKKPTSSTITSADIMTDSVLTVLKTGAYIVFFGMISDILSLIPLLKNIFPYFTEMASASAKISILPVSPRLRLTLIAAMLSFGGICMQIQIFSFLKGLPVNKFIYFTSQFIKSSFSAFFCYIFFPLVENVSTSTAYTTFAHSFTYSHGIPIFYITIPIAIILLIPGIKKRQV